MPAVVMKFAIPGALLLAAWKIGKVPPKELLVIAGISIAANMIAPSLPVIGNAAR